MKKLFALVAITTLTMSMSVPSFGTALTPQEVPETETAFPNKPIVYDDLSVEPDYNIELTTDKPKSNVGVVNYDVLQQVNEDSRTSSRPDKFHDLDDEDYFASFGTNTHKTYTNYYFNPSSDGKIWVGISNVDCKGLTITCYEYGSNDKVSSWKGDAPKTNTSIKFSGLDSDKTYYFKFSTNILNSISGSSRIYNH